MFNVGDAVELDIDCAANVEDAEWLTEKGIFFSKEYIVKDVAEEYGDYYVKLHNTNFFMAERFKLARPFSLENE